MGKAANLASIGSIADTSLQFRNRILNPGMVIDQRNAGASVTPGHANFLVDRWQYLATQSSKFTAQQNAGAVTPPVGYGFYLGFTSTSSYSVLSSDYFGFQQPIEGFNTADLSWGTANAQTVTLSFWVRSSLTGTFGGALSNSANTRSYPFTYTISAANTWEQKTVTVTGDTSGTWVGATNGTGIKVIFGLGAGSTFSGTAGAWAGSALYTATGATSVVGTNGATFYITGVQLERGANQNPVFENRPYGVELAMCQRYYERRTVGSQNNERLATTGLSNGSTSAQFPIQHLVQKRGTPSINVGNLSNSATYDGTASGTPTAWSVDNTGIFITNIQLTGLTTALGRAIHWSWSNASPVPFIEISAEL